MAEGGPTFRIGGGLQDLPSSVPARKHKLERNNVERAVNDEMMEKRLMGHFEKFPMHTHKPGGLVREVQNEDELQDALSKGWKADIRECVGAETAPATGAKAPQLTIKQAKARIKEIAGDGAALAAFAAEETASGGGRAEVLQAIEAAADALGAPKTPAAKPAKPAKSSKK